jgi:tRNA 2-thiocytidine biosynthesis protein TtcA
MDREAFDFAGLAPTGVPDPDGDIAFDVDPVQEPEAPAPTIDAGAIPIRRRAVADNAPAASAGTANETPR